MYGQKKTTNATKSKTRNKAKALGTKGVQPEEVLVFWVNQSWLLGLWQRPPAAPTSRLGVASFRWTEKDEL